MNSYNYEVVCKNILIKELKKRYQEDFTIEELHMVWFVKALKNYKCLITDLRDNQRYYELTFNGELKEIYLDIYQKEHHVVIESEKFNYEVQNQQ